MGLFDLGWVLKFVNVLGCGLVVAVVVVGGYCCGSGGCVVVAVVDERS